MNNHVLNIWKKISHKSELPKYNVFVRKIIFDIIPIGVDDLCIGGTLRRVFILDSSNNQVHLLTPCESVATTNKDDIKYQHRILLCSETPYYEIKRIELSPSGRQLALYGPHEVDVMELTSLPLTTNNKETKNFTCKSQRLFKSPKPSSQDVLSVKWHPDRADSLLVLTSNDCLHAYDTTLSNKTRQSPIVYQLGTKLSETENSQSKNLSVTRALRETSVDFEVAQPPVDSDDDEDWPLLVLRGTGEVVMVTNLFSKTAVSNQVVAMVPATEDNYGTDFTSLLCIRGKPNLLVLASSFGQLHHVFLLAGPTLCVIDRADLNLDVCSSSTTEKSDQPQVWLERDVFTPHVYNCIHEMGVHRVVLPWLPKVRLFYNNKEESTCPPALSPSTVLDFVVCTKLTPQIPGMVLVGLAVHKTGSRMDLIGVTSTNQLLEVYLRSEPSDSTTSGDLFSFSEAGESVYDRRNRGVKSQEKDNFLQHIKQILQQDSPVPIFRVPEGASVTEKQCVDLIVQVTEALRSGSLARLEKAREEWSRRVGLVGKHREFQLEEVDEVGQKCSQLQRRAEGHTKRLSVAGDRLEGLQDRFATLAGRMTGINGTLSHAEVEARNEITRISRCLDSTLRTQLEGIRARLDESHRQVQVISLDQRRSARYLQQHGKSSSAGGLALTPDKAQKVAAILREEGNQLQSLMQKVKTLSLGVNL